MDVFHGWSEPRLMAAALIAGALNAVAGGGSLLSFPMLLTTGVAPIQANATNTVALWPGQLTSIAGYFSDLKTNFRLLLPVCSAALLGGLAGAIVLLHTGQSTFMTLVPWLLLFAAGLFAISSPVSRRLLRNVSGAGNRHAAVLPLWIGIGAVSFYIGYFGAGGGFLIMSILAIFGIESIRQINALKAVATTMANGIAVVTFIAGRQIEWGYCLPMMVAAAVGGYLGAHFSRRLNPGFVRFLVVAIGVGMSAYFFWKNATAK